MSETRKNSFLLPFMMISGSLMLLIISDLLFGIKISRYLIEDRMEELVYNYLKRIPISVFEIKNIVNFSCILYCFSCILMRPYRRSNNEKYYYIIHSFLILFVFAVLNNTILAEYIYIMDYSHEQYTAVILRWGISIANMALLISSTFIHFYVVYKCQRHTRIFYQKFHFTVLFVVELLVNGLYWCMFFINNTSFYLIHYDQKMNRWNQQTGFNSTRLRLTIFSLLIGGISFTILFKYISISDVLFKYSNMKMNNDILYTQDVRGVFHSYKNVLLGVKLLARKAMLTDTKEECTEILKEIIDKAEFFSLKATDFLNIYKKPVMKYKETDAAQCVKEACEQIMIPEDIQFSVSYESKEAFFFGEGDLLIEAIKNLLTNSIDAVQANKSGNGIIRVLVWTEDPWIAISVYDNGLGIPKKNKRKVFNPLYSTKNAMLNWGMGLAYVRMVTILHDGNVSFKSKEGEGTEFQIILPIDM